MPDPTPRTIIPNSTPNELMVLVKHFFAMFVRGWRLIAISVVITLTLAMIYLAKAPRIYDATAKILILQQGGRPLSVANNDTTRSFDGAEDQIETHAAIISSPLVVGRAIEQAGLAELPSLIGYEIPVNEAIRRLKVTRPDRLAKILQIRYSAGSRDEAILMVQAITKSYEAFLKDTYQKKSGEVISLIEKARKDLSQELAKLEKEYLQSRQNNSGLTADEAGHSFVSRRLDQWDRAANDAMVKAVHLRSQLDLGKKLVEEGSGLKAIVHAMGQVGGESPSMVNLSGNNNQGSASYYIDLLMKEREELSEKYGPHYAKVQELQDQITRIQQRTHQSRSRFEGVEIRELLGAIDGSLKTIETMQTEIKKRFDEDLKQAQKVEINLLTESNLRSNLERHRSLFNTVVDQLKQAHFVEDFSSVSAQTIEPANGLRSPVSPRILMVLALALVAGLMMGSATVVVADRFDSRIRTLSEMRRVLGLPLLGQVSQLAEDQLAALGELGMACHAMPRSFWVEGYRAVRTNLEFLRRTQPAQVLLVASPHSGDGKSITASNLAISLAQVGRRVLLVDADLRKPSQDKIHSKPGNIGLVQILKGVLPLSRVVQRTAADNLDLIAAGPEVSNPAELLTSPLFHEFIAEVRQRYDTVIIDSSPILAVTEPMIIAAAVDGVVLVVRTSKLKHHEAERALELLRTTGAPIFGFTANGIIHESDGYGYGYGYGARPSTGILPMDSTEGEEELALVEDDGHQPDLAETRGRSNSSGLDGGPF